MRSAVAITIVAFTVMAGRLDAQAGLDRFIPPSPVPAGFIHDGGPVLDASHKASLNARLRAHQATGNGDIGVAILPDIGDYPAYEVGTAIYRAWKIGTVDTIGSARRNVGVLLLIVPKELAPSGRGDCWITTGVGAEGVITDATAGRICREAIIPHLRNRDHAAAILAGIDAIAAELTGIGGTDGTPAQSEPAAISQPDSAPFRLPGIVLAMLIPVGFGVGLVTWHRRKRRKPRLCPQGHGAMKRLDETADDAALATGQQLEEHLKSVDYDVWECGACGERIVLRYRRWFTGYSECPTCKFWTVKTRTRTVIPATTVSGGLEETIRKCQHCGFGDTRQHVTPSLSSSSSSSSDSGGSSSSSSSGGSSFGGSGSSAGGGGGSSY